MKKGNIITCIIVIVVVGAILGIWYFYPKLTAPKELEKFVIGLDKDIDGFHPKTEAEVVSSSVNGEIFSGLSDFSREGKLVADLAESWANPNDLTWDISLKKGVKLHNGTEMTAEDVEFSLVDVPKEIEEETGDFYSKESVTQIDKVEVVDDYTIKITTKNPYPLLMNDLAGFPILCKEYIGKEGYDANPVGTGPYKFVSREEGQAITLERFEDYYGVKPIAKKVIYKIIPEEKERIDALKKGEVDFVIQLTLDSLDEIEKATGIKSAITSSIGITFLGMDTNEKTPGIKLAKNPLSNSKIRQAIAYGIDKDKIIEEAFQGRAQKAIQLSTPDSFGFNPEVETYSYNPEEAKKLLDEGGYLKGFEVELLSPDDDRAKVAQIIGQQLPKIGVKTKVTILPRGEFFGKLFQGEASFFLLTILDEARDTAGLATAMYHTSTEEYGSLNLVNYSSPKVDELIEKAMGTLDSETRRGYALEITNITINEDLPYFPLYISEFIGGVKENLEFSQRPDGSINLADLSFAGGK